MKGKLKCIKCNTTIESEDIYCQNCGVKLEKNKAQQKDKKPQKEESIKTRNNFVKEKLLRIKDKNFSTYLLVIITTLVCLLVFGSFYNFYLKDQIIETTKKEVTVTDKGIADSVEKAYDSVVVVKNYVNDQLYSTGTGVVYKKDNKYGYILTNNHVINNNSAIKLVFTNNKEKKAEVVGSDEYSDIAVLRVDKKDIISVAEIGNSTDLRVGDTAFAVGAPIDSSTYSWTVTRGIISGKNRVVEVASSNNSSKYIMEVLQTDAAINQGNSGGPLCNANGEVIGITNMKLSSTTIEGMGFAIPIEKAVEYANKFVSGETISRPYLGVSIYDEKYGIFEEIASGVYIESVEKNSPAEKAGLKKKDKILKINNVEVSDSSYFKYELYKYKVGDKIKIVIERNKKEKSITVNLTSTGNIN